MSRGRDAAAGFLFAVGAAVAAPAILMLPASVAAAAPLPAGLACLARSRGPVPTARRHNDTSPVTAADLAAVPAGPDGSVGGVGEPFLGRLAGRPRLPRKVRIPVYVHVIKGIHRGERSTAGPRRVHRMLRVLNRGFHGKQSRANTPTRYTFALHKIDYTRREGWYHAFLYGPRDDRMRRALHRGGKGALNVWVNSGGPKGQPVLGWTTFPWQQHRHPELDGVTVNWRAMPWGNLRHYHHGDTLIHEVGHWMGLFHTFEGGCRPPGDMVADTPFEADPSYSCNTRRDTCRKDPGRDPVHNFMDYSWDTCMNRFTPGQVARMDRAFARYRR